MTTEQIFDLKYKVENPVLKKWSLRHGVIDCMRNVQTCLRSGFGYMGSQRIDRNFIQSLSHADRSIYNGVTAWLNQ